MSAAAPPSYVIACTPRTGSWLMCDLLRSVRVAGRPAEYAVLGDTGSWREYYGAVSHRAYFDRLRELYSSANGAAGMKMMWWQFEALRLDADRYLGGHRKGFDRLQDLLATAQVIRLRRHDPLRQAVSWVRAQQSGRWSCLRSDEPAGPLPLRYDAEAIRDCVARIQCDERNWSAALATAGLPTIDVWYEDLADDWKAAVAHVLEQLHAPVRALDPAIKPRLARQADARSEEWVSRARSDLDQPSQHRPVEWFVEPPSVQRVRGKPRSTLEVAGSGQRDVTTLPRV